MTDTAPQNIVEVKALACSPNPASVILDNPTKSQNFARAVLHLIDQIEEEENNHE